MVILHHSYPLVLVFLEISETLHTDAATVMEVGK